MTILDYVEIPSAATRLRSSLPPGAGKRADVQPVTKITTSLPNPSPPSSPSARRRRNSSFSISTSALATPGLSFLPQLLLSSSLPPGTSATTSSPSNSDFRRKLDPRRPTLLSSRDPLSLPIMTSNFKRFVPKVGPLFWLQDRVEEIILWKRGWKLTSVWLAVYVFLCFFPRLILLIPHMALIAVILSTYPYPPTSKDPLYTPSASDEKANASHSSFAASTSATEGTVSWQANLQGLQNLMGAIADLYSQIQPYTYHLSLSPPHISGNTKAHMSRNPSPHSRSPYTPHLLVLLVLTLPPFIFIVSLPCFPFRGLCLFLGLAPFAFTHPYIQSSLPTIVEQGTTVGRTPLMTIIEKWTPSWAKGRGLFANVTKLPLVSLPQRLIDDDNLPDECWNAEMREVELWENERLGGSPLVDSSSSGSNAGRRGWSKANLRSGERKAWTRGRDGWNGIGPGCNPADEEGEVSSNLTFSLAPGWAFVETEDWRKDVSASWSECGGDSCGWVYTNDTWLEARPAPYTSGGGSTTRRRRWMRRIWYDPSRTALDG